MTSLDNQPGRLVLVDARQRDAAQQYASSMRNFEMDAIADFLDGLVAAFDAAPDLAGRHGAIRVAITNAYYDARNAGETMETAADNARDAVLVALGANEPSDGGDDA